MSNESNELSLFQVDGPAGRPNSRTIRAANHRRAAILWRDAEEHEMRLAKILGFKEKIGVVNVRVRALHPATNGGVLTPRDDCYYLVNDDTATHIPGV